MGGIFLGSPCINKEAGLTQIHSLPLRQFDLDLLFVDIEHRSKLGVNASRKTRENDQDSFGELTR